MFEQYWGIKIQRLDIEPTILNINVFSPYYTCTSSSRQAELDACVKWNSNIPGIKLFLITDKSSNIVHTENVTILRRSKNGRIKYQEILEFIRKYTLDNEINCIINSDIILDKNFTKKLRLSPRDCLCLTRHEVYVEKIDLSNILSLNVETVVKKLVENPASQDLWLFTGHVNDVVLDFYMGIPGCDNLTSLEFYNKGYRLLNLAKLQRIYHIHSNTNNISSYPFTYFLLPEFKLCNIEIE
ncbi:MAG: hypothetical protein EBT86_06815 [Actinobacteria bacterium]|nr:hypothetical protein [Actinomycetota bacterium]